MNNQVLDSIKTRFSCRSFTDRALTDEQLTAILEAASQSPSALNLQPWRIIAITNKDLISELDAEGMRVLSGEGFEEAYQRITGRGGTLLYGAPVVICILGNRNESSHAPIDCGIVASHIALAATSMGLASCIHGLSCLIFLGENKEKFREKLGFPEGFDLEVTVLIGHPAKTAEPHKPDPRKVTVIQ